MKRFLMMGLLVAVGLVMLEGFALASNLGDFAEVGTQVTGLVSIGWLVVGMVLVFLAAFGIVKLLGQHWMDGMMYLGIAVVSAGVIMYAIKPKIDEAVALGASLSDVPAIEYCVTPAACDLTE